MSSEPLRSAFRISRFRASLQEGAQLFERLGSLLQLTRVPGAPRRSPGSATAAARRRHAGVAPHRPHRPDGEDGQRGGSRVDVGLAGGQHGRQLGRRRLR